MYTHMIYYPRGDKMATSEAQKRATMKYDAKNTKQYHLKLNLTTDAELIEYLEKSGNIQGTIKAAMEDYMKKNP